MYSYQFAGVLWSFVPRGDINLPSVLFSRRVGMCRGIGGVLYTHFLSVSSVRTSPPPSPHCGPPTHNCGLEQNQIPPDRPNLRPPLPSVFSRSINAVCKERVFEDSLGTSPQGGEWKQEVVGGGSPLWMANVQEVSAHPRQNTSEGKLTS